MCRSLDEVAPLTLRLRRIGQAAVAVACLIVVVACSGSSPRPNTTASAPPVPEGATALGGVDWTNVQMPAGLGEEAHLYDAASSPAAFVLVGDTGAFAFNGIVLRSTDGRAWQAVHDPDITEWGLSRVIATDSGFLAIGGKFSNTQADGSTSWTSALLTSGDGTDWAVRHVLPDREISAIASRGSLALATADNGFILVSRDSGATWTEIAASRIGFGSGQPSTLGVLKSGPWVALGTAGMSAAAWASDDGEHWSRATMDAADPIPGIASVTPTSVAVSPWGAVAAGVEDSPKCLEDNEFCPRYGTGWSTADGLRWSRLPRGTPLIDQWGSRVWSAGSAGFVADDGALKQSPTGWTWTPVPGDSGKLSIEVLAMRDNVVVAYGMDLKSDTDPSAIWVGRIRSP